MVFLRKRDGSREIKGSVSAVPGYKCEPLSTHNEKVHSFARMYIRELIEDAHLVSSQHTRISRENKDGKTGTCA